MKGYKQFRIALLTLFLLLLCASTALASVFLAYPKQVGL
ncbi:MAG TPA: peptidase M23, partial [Desulfovibrio sp.]|nr:peptidase M23 [Desulfovibrio sp.]